LAEPRGLAFLPIMAVALLAVQDASIIAKSGFLWIATSRSGIPVHPPLIFAALITLYVDMAFASTLRQRIAIWALVARSWR